MDLPAFSLRRRSFVGASGLARCCLLVLVASRDIDCLFVGLSVFSLHSLFANVAGVTVLLVVAPVLVGDVVGDAESR